MAEWTQICWRSVQERCKSLGLQPNKVKSSKARDTPESQTQEQQVQMNKGGSYTAKERGRRKEVELLQELTPHLNLP